MITCDGCRKSLRLEDLQTGRAREVDGKICCRECLPQQPPVRSPDALVCDVCAGEVPVDYLRRGLAVVKAEQILCARCKIKLERQDAVRLDVRLIGSALLLFVILPISVALVINSVNRPVPASVRPPETEPVGQVGSNDGQPMVLFSQKLARKDRRIAALEQELEVTRHRGVREQTIDDLKRTRGEIRNNYRALFKAGLSSQSISERILALMRMAEIGDRSLAELVIPSLEDEAPEVRALAAKLLGVFRTAQASSALLKLLGDDDRLVQESAARALARITGRPLTYFGKRTKDGPIGTQGPGSRDG